MSNITEESQEIASTDDEKKEAALKGNADTPNKKDKDSIESVELSQNTGSQHLTDNDMKKISVETGKTSREAQKIENETQKSKSTFKPIDFNMVPTDKPGSRGGQRIETPNGAAGNDLASVADYIGPNSTSQAQNLGSHDFMSPLLENGPNRSQQFTSEASSEGMIMAAKNNLSTPKGNDTVRHPNASPQSGGDYTSMVGQSRNEQQT